MDLLSIIIVNLNTKKLLQDCLVSILKDKSLEEKVEIIVVDNGSTDGSVEMINEEWLMVKRKKSSTINHQPSVIKLISNQINLGFAKANNQGIMEAKGEYILLLNSDTKVKSDTLDKLVDFAKQHPEAGIIGSRLLNPDGSTQPSIYHFPTIFGAIKEFWLGQKGAFQKFAAPGTSPVEAEAVTFAAVLISRKTIDKVGLLDERYFMYFEDLDYCRRVWQGGMKVYSLPSVEVIHYHGASGQGSEKTYQYLVESSKIYNGLLKYILLTLILWSGQKWQKLLKAR